MQLLWPAHGLLGSTAERLKPWVSSEKPQRDGRATAHEGAAQTDADNPSQNVSSVASLPRLLQLYAVLGATTFGGSSARGFDEFVRRRGWITPAQYQEGHVLAQVLPGSTGPSMIIYVGRLLGGAKTAPLCYFAYSLPGALIMLVVTLFAVGTDLPPWTGSVLRGASVAAVSLFANVLLRSLKVATAARFGPVLAVGTFVANGVFGIHAVPLLVGLSLVSLGFNSPKK